MYDTLHQAIAAEDAADRKVACQAIRRAVSEVRAGVSIGCTGYSHVLKGYQGLAEKLCTPYGY
jgi:hypothetical protein